MAMTPELPHAPVRPVQAECDSSDTTRYLLEVVHRHKTRLSWLCPWSTIQIQLWQFKLHLTRENGMLYVQDREQADRGVPIELISLT